VVFFKPSEGEGQKKILGIELNFTSGPYCYNSTTSIYLWMSLTVSDDYRLCTTSYCYNAGLSCWNLSRTHYQIL